ncbi:MAG TPA: protein translocase subunit SecD [Candidatus Paceibacterota bacterium]|nr:protein translocase subunit SecD [Candidatus Paceibacterota bacterium]
MLKTRLSATLLLLVGILLGYAVYSGEVNKDSYFAKYPFKLGLDLRGGVHLIYKADISKLAESTDVSSAMSALKDVIERRVNIFGVSEPVIQVEEKSALGGGKEYRLIVELPGITDVAEAIKMIGATPLLDFKTERPAAERDAILAEVKKFEAAQAKVKETGQFDLTGINMELAVKDPYYVDSELNGRHLKSAELQFQQNSLFPTVGIEFNAEGEALFAKLTKENVGKTIAIYLDGQPISAPVVKEEIKSGKAEISGNFTREEAKTLVGRLNSGALPVPIELLSTQNISAPLGNKLLNDDLRAGIWGTLAVAVFLILWYRLPGLIAVVSLAIYIIFTLTVFKLFGVTMTAAGIAGVIMSIGMATDANILIFERTKEELKKGRTVSDAVKEGFDRAWTSIRDSNISSMITAAILFWLGTSLIRGFALTFGLGVLISMFTAITVTRTFLYSFRIKDSKLTRFLFSNGSHIY